MCAQAAVPSYPQAEDRKLADEERLGKLGVLGILQLCSFGCSCQVWLRWGIIQVVQI